MRRNQTKHFITDSEVMRIKIYLFGGFHYRTVAARVYGNGNSKYVPTNAEVARVGKVARESNLSSRDWRNGKTSAAKSFLAQLGKSRHSNLKLKIVA